MSQPPEPGRPVPRYSAAGQWGTTGPPGYPGYPDYPGLPGPFGPPPRRPRTGLWTGLGIGAVVLVAFLITGLVTPGFLVGGSEDPVPSALANPEPESTQSQIPKPATSSASAPDPADNAAQLALIQDFVRKVSSGNRQDQDAAVAMGCPSHRTRVEGFAIFGSGEKYTYDLGQATRAGSDVALPITGTMNGLPYQGVVTATTQNGKPCVKVDDSP